VTRRRHLPRLLGTAAVAVAVLGALALGLGSGCTASAVLEPGPEHAMRLVADGPGWPTAPDSLLVVSYNIQYGEDVALALDDLARSGLDAPDVLLLQEMSPAGIETLAHHLGLHAYYQPASIHPYHDRKFGNAVLSRWPILASRLLVLPHATPVSGLRRIAVACDLDVAGRAVRAISLHLATPVVSVAARREQAAAVLDSLVAGWDGPLILGGDFNTSLPADLPDLRKTYRRAGLHPVPPAGCTVRWHWGRLLGARCELDHIFLRGLAPGAHGVASEAAASDHLPIWARVGWSPPR
jgi:endonuclease/exonuclease/phosphatase family metal-dependent hydrolase